ncbi:MAG: hypothetical protein HDS68_04415 [Bacteroidales bacterium]|nr:hypothetical protein [Bacteroidales bacterium]
MKFTLKGDNKAVLFTSLWETDLKNADGFQDGCSMAVSGNTLYLCVRQYDPIETGEDQSHIFIRRFNTDNGEELTSWIIECPEQYRMLQRSGSGGNAVYSPSKYVNFSIANDNYGNLLLLSLNAHNQSVHKGIPNVTLIPLSDDGELVTEQAVTCETAELADDCYNTSSGKDLCALTRIDRITGDIQSGNYSVAFLPCRTVGQPIENFIYVTADVTASESGELTASINTIPYQRVNMSTIESIRTDEIRRPEMHVVADNDDYAVISIRADYDNDGTGAPILMKRNNNQFEFSEKASFETMPGLPEAQGKIAKKFYTFKHGNHIMAVYPLCMDTENGSQFAITEWTNPSTFSSLSSNIVMFPTLPFSYPEQIEQDTYRQLAISRPVTVETDPATFSRSDNNDEPISDVFVCSPGSGIAALRIAPAPIITSINGTFDSDTNGVSLNLDGNILRINGDNDPADFLVITDIQGHVLYKSKPCSNELSLDRFGRGMYIASYGSAHLKVVVK